MREGKVFISTSRQTKSYWGVAAGTRAEEPGEGPGGSRGPGPFLAGHDPWEQTRAVLWFRSRWGCLSPTYSTRKAGCLRVPSHN